LSLVGITLAGIAANSSPAQVFSSNGRSGVYVQGNGQGMAGTFDENGFHGIAVGPDGRVRRFEGHQPNPFLKDRREGIGSVGMLSGSGAFGC